METHAKQGDVFAQYNLGLMHNNRWGVPQDDKTAVNWYRLAAAQGNGDAYLQRKLRRFGQNAVR